MKIQKFGGTSVGKPGALSKSADIVIEHAKTSQLAVVASALCGVTDTLISLAKAAKNRSPEMQTIYFSLVQRHFTLITELADGDSELTASVSSLFDELKQVLEGIKLLRELSDRTRDLVMSYGEKLSCTLLAAVLRKRGLDAEYCDARNFMFTDATYGNAAVDYDKTTPAIREWFRTHKKVQIITGFIGTSPTSDTTTLGRGGGDLTASVIGAVLLAESIEVWTDVDGVLTADPRAVEGTRVIETLSYEEAMELSYFGAKVIYAPTMSPAMRSSVPIVVKNTFNPTARGTTIRKEPGDDRFQIRAISAIEDITLVVLEGSDMVGVRGVAGRLFSALSSSVNVILISQASSEHSICLAVKPDDADKAKHLIDTEFEREIEKGFVNEVQLHTDVSIIAVVGSQMKRVPGVAGLVTTMMGEHGFNIIAIAQGSSELNMSMVVSKEDLKSAVGHIHAAFFATGPSTLRDPVRSVHLFIASNRLDEWTTYIEQEQKQTFADKNINIKVLGVCDDTRMKATDMECPSPQHDTVVKAVRANSVQSLDFDDASWDTDPQEALDLEKFINHICHHREHVKGRVAIVFLDDLNSKRNVQKYPDLLNKGVAIVTANQTMWESPELYGMLPYKRFLWSPASGFTPSACSAILSLRSDDSVHITLESNDPGLVDPLHALAACSCTKPCSTGCRISHKPCTGNATYTLHLATAHEETSLTCTLKTDQPRTVPQMFKKLISIPLGM